MPGKSEFLAGAEERGCPIVAPRQILLNQLEMQIKQITGHAVPRQRLVEVLAETLGY